MGGGLEGQHDHRRQDTTIPFVKGYQNHISKANESCHLRPHWSWFSPAVCDFTETPGAGKGGKGTLSTLKRYRELFSKLNRKERNGLKSSLTHEKKPGNIHSQNYAVGPLPEGGGRQPITAPTLHVGQESKWLDVPNPIFWMH